ncbi:MAG TPA: hypothetical protein VIM10_18615 [Actinopolymorphaceae bacterium]
MWLPWRRAAAPVAAPPPAPAPLDAPTRPAHWAGLPPIQRVVAEQPVVLEPGVFEAGLQSWHSLTFLAPLEHLVSTEGPAGSADLARPRPYAPTADMPLRQPAPSRAPALQRVVTSASAPQSAGSPRPALLSAPAVEHPVMELRTESLPPAETDAAAPDVQRAQADSAIDTAPLLGARDDAVADGQSMPVPEVSTPDSLPTLGERPAFDTSLDTDTGPMTMPTAAGQVDSTPSSATPAVSSPAPTAWRTRPGGIGAPLREMPTRPASAAQVPIQRSTSGPIVAPTPAPTPASPPPGLPISMPAADSAPDAAPAHSESAGEPTPVAMPLVAMPLVAPTLGSVPIGAFDLPGSAADPGATESAASSASSALPLQPSGSADVGQSSAESSSPQRLVLPALGGSWREPASASVQRRSLVGEAPLRPFASPTGPDGALPFASSPTGGSPAPQAPALQRLSVGTSGPAAGDGSGVRLDSLTPVDSASIASLPSPGSSAPSSRPTAAPGSMPALASVTSLTTPISAWPTWTGSTARSQTTAVAVSRLGLGEASSAAPALASVPEQVPIVSREADAVAVAPSDTAPAATNPVASATTAADAAAPAAPSPAGGAAAAGPDLDDLARKLYDRLRGRLAAELRLDRERIGSLTDLRR